MSRQSDRLELLIDVFEQHNQRALALPTLSSAELVTSILQEFRELDYLGDNPTNYQLLKAAENTPLNAEQLIGEQLVKGQRLVLVEQEAALPSATARPSQPVYLRNLASGQVFKLYWVPAIIGRVDPDDDNNDQLAVNLDAYPTGKRVSRRHACITEESGQFYLESLSQNTTSLQESDGKLTMISRRRKLQNGNIIHLDRSGLTFKFIIRQPTPPPTALLDGATAAAPEKSENGTTAPSLTLPR